MDPTTTTPRPTNTDETPGTTASPRLPAPLAAQTAAEGPASEAPAQPAAPATPAPPPSSVRPVGAWAPAYDLQAQHITIVIQLQPADGDEQGRPVLVSLRAGTQAPLFPPRLRYNELVPLPPAVTTLLQQVQLWALNEKQKAQRNRDGNATSAAPAKPATPPPPAPVAGPAAALAPADPDSKQLSMF